MAKKRKALKKYEYDPDFAVPPGETLRETIDELGMTQKDLAIRTELTPQTIIRILSGEQPITYETAAKLEMVTGVPARMWNNLEMQYREQLAKIEERERLAADLDWLRTIPTKELIEREVLSDTKDKTTLLRETLVFFAVSSTDAWHEVWTNDNVAARRSQCFESDPGRTATWIRLGELQAAQIECKAYDKKRFLRAIHSIRGLTRDAPKDFCTKMRELCGAAGVAVVFVPEIKKVPWHGACKWLASDKAMIQLSLRSKKDDQFWFSFFHESSHILNDSKKDMFINNGKEDDPREVRANKFAADILIPEDREAEVMQLKTKREVLDLAEDLGISPGIVVGRYQRLTKKWHWFNDLKRTLVWAK